MEIDQFIITYLPFSLIFGTWLYFRLRRRNKWKQKAEETERRISELESKVAELQEESD